MSKKSLHDLGQGLQPLVSLSKRRGFVFQSSEIYGGLNSCYDYGPLGSQLKLNVKLAWWKAMTGRQDIVGLDASILMAPSVWKASGHIDGFSDPLVDCKKCGARFRADNTASYLKDRSCPSCGSKELTDPRDFNLMFSTQMGALEGESFKVYLRPETAQGIFVNFENVQQSTRKKIPFGIAQIGKAFRNEITPGNFIFRTREFEQMEMQYFVQPDSAFDHYKVWKDARLAFHVSLGLDPSRLRYHDHKDGELAHYAKAAVDIEYDFPIGWSELEGIHHRSDFDLSEHQKLSGKSLEYFDERVQKKYIPYVIETSVGADRLVLALLCDAYTEEQVAEGDTRVVLKLKPSLAPFQAAVLPLSKKPELQDKSQQVLDGLAKHPLISQVDYDETASIGKRYRRQDEIGTPFCVTVDFQTLEDQTLTVRDRDSMTQVRLHESEITNYFSEVLK